MVTFLRSETFDTWLAKLKDKIGRARILHRIRAAEHGNFGDVKPVGDGVSEMCIHVGPGYRVYYTRRGELVYLLLVGGDKSTQKRDVQRALEMARDLEPAGLLLNSPRPELLRFMPALNVTVAEIDQMLAMLSEVIRRL